MASPWFGQGFDADSYQKGGGQPKQGGMPSADTYNRSRFFAAVGTEKHVIFLHDLKDCMQLAEHELWDPDVPPRGKPVHMVCRKYLDKAIDKRCLACDKKSKPGRVLLMSIIDVDGFVIRKTGEPDKEIKNLKRLFVIPYPMITLFINKQKDAGGSLRLKKFRINRYRQNSSRLGEDFTLLGTASEEELKAQSVDYAPYEYDKIVPVLSYEGQLELDAIHPNAVYERSKKDGASAATPSQTQTPRPLVQPASRVPPVAQRDQPQEDSIDYGENQQGENSAYPPF